MTPRIALILVAAALALGSGALFRHRGTLHAEIEGLKTAIAQADTGTVDARLALEVDRVRVALEAARSAPAKGAEAHLALVLGDGLLTLERGDIVFRSTTVRSDVPRGVHVIEAVEERRILLAGDLTIRAAAASDTLPPTRGTVLVPRADFEAIRPNLKPGQSAFFF